MTRRASIACAVFLAFAGCETSSQLVVGIITNLAVTTPLTTVRLEAYRNEVLIDQQFFDISDHPGGSGTFILPGSYDYYSPRGGTPIVEIDVSALDGMNAVDPFVLRRSQIALESQQALFYRMSLVAACGTTSAGSTCADGFTCIEGLCSPDPVDVKVLPHYEKALVDTIQCDSGSGFIDTSTCGSGSCALLPIAGTCQSDEFCQEGTCYKYDDAAPRTLAFGEVCNAAHDSCAPNACAALTDETVTRCRQSCTTNEDCTQLLPYAAPANVTAAGIVCENKVCTFTCNPLVTTNTGCVPTMRCEVVSDNAQIITPDCVSQTNGVGTKAVGAACTQGGAESEECVPGAQCLAVNGGPSTCHTLCSVGAAGGCTTGQCTGIASSSGFSSQTYGVCP